MAPKNPIPSTSAAELRPSGVARLSVGFTVGAALGVVAVGLSTLPPDPSVALVLVAAHGLLGVAVASIDAALRWLAAVVAHRMRARIDVRLVGWAALAAAAAAPVGASLSTGPWVERNGLGLALRIGAPLAIGGASGAVFWAFARRGAGDEGVFRHAARVLALAFGCACIAADARVLVGLYPAAHSIWLAFALLVAWLGPGESFRARWRPKSTVCLSLAAANAMLLLWASLAFVGGGPSLRGALVIASSHAATVFERFGPALPPLLEAEIRRIEEAGDEPEAPGVAGSLRAPPGANVLFVTVDCLRADALPPARDERPGIVAPGSTPRLDAFLASSLRFRRAYSQASSTNRSIPATFRSVEVFEDSRRTGTPLPTRMRALGLVPIASVTTHLVEPRTPQLDRIVDGFDDVAVCEEGAMDDQVPATLELLRRHAGGRFFAWVHFFSVHGPGFDGRLLDQADGPWRDRYARSLRWTDGQFGALLDGLREHGLDDRTIVVLTADHGESLGDGGYDYHGTFVSDPEVRVPLAIRVPGASGRLVERTVGNIDLVPSLLELLSEPADPALRGRSFVGLLTDDDLPWERSYVIENRDGTQMAVVRGTDKLILDVRSASFARYDLARDPRERTNLYRAEGTLDAALRSELVRRRPDLLAGELHDPRVRRRVETSLARFDELRLDDLDFLLQLLALSPTERGLRLARHIVETSEADAPRLLAIRRLSALDRDGVGAALGRRLAAIRGTRAESALLEALANEGVPPVAIAAVADRCGELATEGPLERAEPCLRHLLAADILDGDHALRAGAPVLLRRDVSVDDAVAVRAALLLLSIANVRAAAPDDVVASVLARLSNPDPGIRSAAASALGKVGTPSTTARLRDLAADPTEDIRVRRAAFVATAALEGADAVGFVVEHGREPRLTLEAIRILARLKLPAGRAFLEHVVREGHPFRVDEARAAIEAIDEGS